MVKNTQNSHKKIFERFSLPVLSIVCLNKNSKKWIIRMMNITEHINVSKAVFVSNGGEYTKKQANIPSYQPEVLGHLHLL